MLLTGRYSFRFGDEIAEVVADGDVDEIVLFAENLAQRTFSGSWSSHYLVREC